MESVKKCIWFLCVWLLMGCITDEPACEVCDEVPAGKGVLLSFETGQPDTRSQLSSSEVDYRDVKSVYLYIFEGNTAQAPCVKVANVGWKGEITQKHWISADLKPQVTYTFLAVACDEQAEAVYGFPQAIMPGNSTLGSCRAEVGKLSTAAQVAEAQFFAGYTAKQVVGHVTEVAVLLTRQVTGVLMYLNHIPCQVAYQSATCRVEEMRLQLHKNQVTSCLLWNPSGAPVYGSGLLNDSQTLFSVNFQQAGYLPDASNRYYTKTFQVLSSSSASSGKVAQLDHTFLAGAYLLPLEKIAGTATLSLELWGHYVDGSGQSSYRVLKTYEISHQADGQPGVSTDFDLQQNKLYAIGKKISSSSVAGDKPADLSGHILQMEVVPWNEIPTDHSFPTVTGPARLESDHQADKLVFNAFQDPVFVYVKPAVDQNPSVKKRWTLKVDYTPGNAAFPEDKPADWIHFKRYNELGEFTEYTNEVSGVGEEKVEIVLNDYMVQRQLAQGNKVTFAEAEKFQKDIREARLVVYTEGVDKPYSLPVRQYNALTVWSGGDNKGNGAGYRAVARMDYGCYFDDQTGALVRPETAVTDWGYYSTANLYVAGKNPMDYINGENTADGSYNRFYEKAWAANAYMGSAIQKLSRRVIDLATVIDPQTHQARVVDQNPEVVSNHSKQRDWYLPAYFEMWYTSQTAAGHYPLFGLLNGENYWSSSGMIRLVDQTYFIQIGGPADWRYTNKKSLLKARQMAHFKS